MGGFEVFDRRAAPMVLAPFVTIQKNGPIGLNYAAYQAMGEPVAVELLFDRGNQLVGIRPTQDTDPRAYPVRSQTSRSYILAGQAFTKHYQIDTSVARRYEATVRDRMLVIDLKSGGTVATGVRARANGRKPE